MNKEMEIDPVSLGVKVQYLSDELDQAVVEYKDHGIKNAKYTSAYMVAKGKALLSVEGKNAEERKAKVDIITERELEDHLVWEAIYKYSDQKIRSLQSKLAAHRVLLQVVNNNSYKADEPAIDLVEKDNEWSVPTVVEATEEEGELPF